jgi:hypothetical protein
MINVADFPGSVTLANIPMVSSSVYMLTAPGLNSKNVVLNNKAMALINNAVPRLDGIPLQSSNEVIELPPHAIAFIVLPKAKLSFCK